MKNIILLLILAGLGFEVSGQVSKRDSIANEVNAYVQTVNRAAAIFLDRQRPTDERLKAIAPHAIIYDERQIEQFKQVLLSNDEKPEIRAMALNKICEHIEKDDASWQASCCLVLQSTNTKSVARDETLRCISNLSFSTLIGILDVYPKMVTDPHSIQGVCHFKLVANDDARTKQLLVDGLQNPTSALVPLANAIELFEFGSQERLLPCSI
jgi:hypothetical protein